MLEGNFYLEIRGIKVQIAEPYAFSDVDFVAKQNSDGYMGRNKVIAGEKSKLVFNTYQHENVFESLMQELDAKGVNAEIYFYFGDLKMRLDMETAKTDGYTYLECQALEDNVIYDLDYNKDVKIDLNAELDVRGNYAPKARIYRTYISSAGIQRKSFWKNNKIEEVGTTTNRTLVCLNTIAQIKESDIKNTYTTGADFVRRDWDSWWVRKTFQFIEFQDNYKSITIKIKLKGTYKIGSHPIAEDARYVIFYGRQDLEGQAWYDDAQKMTVTTVSRSVGNTSVDVERTYTFNNVQRGMGIWACWENRLNVTPGSVASIYFEDTDSEMTVSGEAYSFGSISSSVRYYDAIANVLRKITGKDLNVTHEDVMFRDFYFTGNQVRFGDDQPCILTWKDIEEQLMERGLGYEIIGNTVNFRNVEYFHNNTKSIDLLHGEDTSVFEISEDTDKNVNTLIYKYKKFQAQKETPLEGNAGTTNGESEWYMQNRFTDKKLTIDLPISRDRFLLENTRGESLAFNENTKTNDDDTGYLFTGVTQNYIVNDVAMLASRFNEDTLLQSFALVNETIGWLKLGVRVGTLIRFEINGSREYVVQEVSGGVMHCTRLNHTEISNETRVFSFTFASGSDYYIDLLTSNNDRTIRQNLQMMRSYLNNYNFYTDTPITNTMYKENKEFVFNGIKEVDPIQKFASRIKPKVITAKCFDEYGKLDEFLQNRNGFVTLHKTNGQTVDVYVIELAQSMKVSECGLTEYNITGQLKN